MNQKSRAGGRLLFGNFILKFLALGFLAFCLPSYANDDRNHNYGVVAADLPDTPTVDEYSRLGASVQMRTQVRDPSDLEICRRAGITCKNFVTGSAAPTAAIHCAGNLGQPANGGWTVDSVSGQCWTGLTVCYGDATPGNCAPVSAAAPSPSLAPYTKCTSAGQKGACTYGGTGLLTATGDDMFRLDGTGKGFLDFLAIGGMGDPYRLKWIERTDGPGGQSMMIPSGPPGSFTDYKGFIDSPPLPYAAVEDACYPVKATLCGALTGLPAIAGECGPADGRAVTAAPSKDLCFAGQASAVTGSGPWNWNCAGWEGGATASCSAPVAAPPIDGECGPADGNAVASKPTGGLCNVGSASSVSGSGPWYWNCAGRNGGNEASCSAPLAAPPPVNGLCGPAADNATPRMPTAGLCTAGTATVVSGSAETGWRWRCEGQNGGTAMTCRTPPIYVPPTVACGSSNGVPVAVAPTAGLCSGGAPSAVTGTGPWNWTCDATDGSGVSASCSAPLAPTPVNGQCGVAHGVPVLTKPTTGLCSIGSPSSVTGSGPWNWTCSGQNGGSAASCNAPKGAAPVNGACGTAHGNEWPSSPAPSGAQACGSGTVSNMRWDTALSSGQWYWSCLGQNGGTDVTYCKTLPPATPVYPECGSANGVAVTSAPTTGLCLRGTPSGISGSGPWDWVCTLGANMALCSAPKASISGQCGPANGHEYNTAAEVTAAGLCANTGYMTPTLTTTGKGWTWTCFGSDSHAATASCQAKIPCSSYYNNMMIVQDISGSFIDDMSNMVGQVNALLNDSTFSSTKLGLASFSDYSCHGYGVKSMFNITDYNPANDNPYTQNLTMLPINTTANKNQFLNVYNYWNAPGAIHPSSGGDWLEADWVAVQNAVNHYASTGSTAPLTIVLATDDEPHQGSVGCFGGSGSVNYPTSAQIASLLKSKNIMFVALSNVNAQEKDCSPQMTVYGTTITHCYPSINPPQFYSNFISSNGIKGASITLNSGSTNFLTALKQGINSACSAP